MWPCSQRHVYLSNHLTIYLSIHPSIYLSIYLSINLTIYRSTALVDLGRFFSFLIYTQSVGLLGRGSARRKAVAYKQDNTKTEQTHTDIYALSGIRIHNPSVRVGEGSSGLRRRGRYDRWTTALEPVNTNYCLWLSTRFYYHVLDCR
jgi:hypothetical protein